MPEKTYNVRYKWNGRDHATVVMAHDPAAVRHKLATYPVEIIQITEATPADPPVTDNY